MSNLNKVLRIHLGKGAGTIVPGAPNAVMARIIQELGFKAVYVTGAGIANSFLGAPDTGLLTLTELVQHVAAIRESVSIPLVVDADTGFGNEMNMARTVKVLERAGANALQIEDQEFPKRCGHFDGKSVIAVDDMVSKIKAAVDARNDPDFIIIARTDALAMNGIDDALDRAARYIDAGADMTFVEAPRNAADTERIARSLSAPQIVNIVHGGLTPMLGSNELRQMGFAMILYANAALQAAMLAMKNVLQHLEKRGSLDGVAHLLMDFKERQHFVGLPSSALAEPVRSKVRPFRSMNNHGGGK
jgi:2-methylisocitrate lyase-like PEP mutase family enzyme